ncbi:MAG: glucose 1-dehydrogenase [Myxococcota bacterium]
MSAVALVTGATSGIGRATAKAFAARGDRIVFTGRRREKGDALAEEITAAGGTAIFVEADVGDEAASRRVVAKALETFGQLDYAFNNAGIEGELGPLASIAEANVDRVLQTNLKGVLWGMKHQVSAMSTGGVIVNNASVAALVGMPGAAVYSASKGAVIAASRSVAHEVAGQGIRVNVISPAGTYSEAFNRFFNNDAAQIQAFAEQHALRRIAQPEEVAATVLWLCSGASSFVTAQNIVVDGGLTTH